MGLPPSPEERPDINGPTVWPTNLTKRIISKKERESCCWPAVEQNKKPKQQLKT
jgi:hypothetical protein